MAHAESKITWRSQERSVGSSVAPEEGQKKCNTFFLSPGAVSDPAPDVFNVFHDPLGLNFPNFFCHLRERKPGNEWAGISM